MCFCGLCGGGKRGVCETTKNTWVRHVWFTWNHKKHINHKCPHHVFFVDHINHVCLLHVFFVVHVNHKKHMNHNYHQHMVFVVYVNHHKHINHKSVHHVFFWFMRTTKESTMCFLWFT